LKRGRGGNEGRGHLGFNKKKKKKGGLEGKKIIFQAKKSHKKNSRRKRGKGEQSSPVSVRREGRSKAKKAKTEGKEITC